VEVEMTGLVTGNETEQASFSAVEAVWDLEEPPQDASFDLPLDHAAILSGLVPFIGMAVAFVAVMVSAAP
jgi:hypothetical protein